MSNLGLPRFPDLFRRRGNLDPKVAAHLLLSTQKRDGPAIQRCLTLAWISAWRGDWFAVRYWIQTFQHLDRLVLPPLLLEDFEPIDPPPEDKGDGNMGREW
jgi:hypothetical protein